MVLVAVLARQPVADARLTCPSDRQLVRATPSAGRRRTRSRGPTSDLHHAPGHEEAMGEACGCHDECASGICVDGVCCSSACTGPCLACNVRGQHGAVHARARRAAAGDPSQCSAQPAASCGLDGLCDGLGGCRNHPDGTVCEAGAVPGQRPWSGAKVCSGGSCTAAVDGGLLSLRLRRRHQPVLRHAAPADSQCAGEPCKDGQCGKKPLGAVCAAARECESGFCADGVCCNVACTGACVSCQEPGKLGQCTPGAGGAHRSPRRLPERGARDLRPERGLQRPGRLRPLRGRHRLPAGVVLGRQLRAPQRVRRAGHLRARRAHQLRAVHVRRGACRGTCASDAECIAAQHLPGRQLRQEGAGPDLPAPRPSASPDFCVDGVCCDTACAGKCVFCALPNALGRCVNVPADAADPRAAAGVTDPARICVDAGRWQPAAPTAAATARAAASLPQRHRLPARELRSRRQPLRRRHLPQRGLRRGHAQLRPQPLQRQPLRPALRQRHRVRHPQRLRRGILRQEAATASPARPATATECASGICAQGVCCAGACTGSCVSCALPQRPGVCTPVPAGPPDPAGACVDQEAGRPAAPTACATARAAAGCTPAGTVCAPATCSGGHGPQGLALRRPGACLAGADGGLHPHRRLQRPGTACETTCTRDSQCVPGTKCFKGRCGLLDNGQPAPATPTASRGSASTASAATRPAGATTRTTARPAPRAAGAAADGTCGARNGRAAAATATPAP